MRTGREYPSRLSPVVHALDPVWVSEAPRVLLVMVPVPRQPRTRQREDEDTSSTSLIQSPSDFSLNSIPPKRYGGYKGRRSYREGKTRG